MASNVCLLLFINLFIYAIIDAIPTQRFGRQVNYPTREELPYGGWAGGTGNPSGASPGAYYGTGLNPNYGFQGPHRNDAEGSISPIYYNQGYSQGRPHNPDWNQQQQQYYSSNSNYNTAWQSPNANGYPNQPYNRYPPGSQGWYATGGNYWYNNGKSIIPHASILIISCLISMVFI